LSHLPICWSSLAVRYCWWRLPKLYYFLLLFCLRAVELVVVGRLGLLHRFWRAAVIILVGRAAIIIVAVVACFIVVCWCSLVACKTCSRMRMADWKLGIFSRACENRYKMVEFIIIYKLILFTSRARRLEIGRP